MKNITKTIFILTSVVLLAACGLHGDPDRILENAGIGGGDTPNGGSGTGGTLTITGLSGMNGWSIYFDNDNSSNRIIGASSVWGSASSPSISGVTISNNQASLPMWRFNTSSWQWERFTGSQSVTGWIIISGGWEQQSTISFSAGSATVTWDTSAPAGGTLTVIGLSGWNGRYIHFDNQSSWDRIIGAESVSGNVSSPTITGVHISGTNASLPMWRWNSSLWAWERFSDSQQVHGTLRITSNADWWSGSDSLDWQNSSPSFTNGDASIWWQSGWW